MNNTCLYLRTSIQDDFGAYWGSIEHRQAPFIACLFRDLNHFTSFDARNLTPCPDFSETTADVQRPYKNYPLGASLGKQQSLVLPDELPGVETLRGGHGWFHLEHDNIVNS